MLTVTQTHEEMRQKLDTSLALTVPPKYVHTDSSLPDTWSVSF
jgi:hypothetical protein